MKVKAITIIKDVEFLEEFNLDRISSTFVSKKDNKTVLDSFFDEQVSNIVGTAYTQNLDNFAIVKSELEFECLKGIDFYETLSNVGYSLSSYFSQFFFNYWYLEDNSIHVDKTIVYINNKQVIQSGRMDNFTNSDSENKVKFISRNDFEFCLSVNDIERDLKNVRLTKNDIGQSPYRQGDTKIFKDPSNIRYRDFSKLEKSKRFLYDASLTPFIPSKISNYMSILEILFVVDRERISYQLKSNVLNFINSRSLIMKGYENGEVLSKKKILVPYDLRSKYVHGSLENVDKELIKQSIFSDELCRKILYEIISNDELHFLLGNDKKELNNILKI